MQARGRLHALLAVALAALALLALELFALRLFDTTEYRLADVYMRAHAASYRADPEIVIVDIDDDSLRAMEDIAGLWAWPREIHADLLEALSEFAPRAVVFDIAFAEADKRRPASDARLSEVLTANPHAFLPAVALKSGAPTSLPPLAPAFAVAGPSIGQAALQLPHAVHPSAWRLGLINSIEDDDGVLRRYRIHTELDGWRLPSLPARVALDLGASLPAGADFVMRWPRNGHQRLPYGELYKTLTERRHELTPDALQVLDALFRNKVVVIGSSAASAFDHHLTPLAPAYPGVDILATAIDNLKNGQTVKAVPAWWMFAYGAALIATLAWAFARRLNPAAIGAALALVSAASVGLAWAAFGRNLFLPLITPLAFAWTWYLLAAVSGYLRERRAREQAVGLFGRFLNPTVVREIVDRGATVESMSGRTRDITVLFSDIRGFTTLSETRPPQEVVALLNRYFERQVEVVFKHGGTLDKFIGDAIMAFWGAPLDDAQHARHAVEAALEMEQVLLDFKRELLAEAAAAAATAGKDTLEFDFDIGIGVHTGPAVVGFIGAQRKLDYTAIGDTVNLASRVEGLTRGVSRVLVTRETMQACGTGNDLHFAHRGAFQVKGRVAEVDLYEPGRTTT